MEDHSLPPSGPEQDTHARLLSSIERTLPSPRNGEGRRKLSLQLEFLLMLLPREKKKSGATSASLSYTSGQLTDSWGEVIWTQLPSHKALSPKGSASSSRLRLPLAPAQAGLPGPELSPTRYFCHPPLHPTGLFLPFLLPSRTLVWFF